MSSDALAEMIAELIQNGMSPSEAARTAQKALSRVTGNSFRGNQDETPEEARKRCIEEERKDPQGLYSYAGTRSGGIFGEAPVALEDFDPSAFSQNADAQLRFAQVESSQETNRLLRDLLESRRFETPPRQFSKPQSVFGRSLAKKKR